MREVNTWPGWNCIRQLGKGSYGNVYEIETVENGNIRKAALKVMSVPQHPEDVQDIYDAGLASTPQEALDYIENQINIMRSEFDMMAELQGRSNIVEVEEYQIHPHENWPGADILIRMELLTPLHQYMRQTPLTETDVVNLGIDICHALQICHTMQPPILHRDIKLGNIMVDARGNFKLGDFGIARMVDGTQCVHTMIGTGSYMAPEVYKKQGYFTTADIYSLGMVLYKLLNNNRDPFTLIEGMLSEQDYTRAQCMRLHGERIPMPCKGSDTLKAVVTKALAYKPEDRFQTAAEFSIALKNCPEFSNNTLEKRQVSMTYGQELTLPLSQKTSGKMTQTSRKKQPHAAKRSKTHKFPFFTAGIGICVICSLLLLGKRTIDKDRADALLLEQNRDTAESSSAFADNETTAETNTTISELQAAYCPRGIQCYYYNGHTYTQFDYNTKNLAGDYDAWETYCESLGGHLATISSVQENAAIYNMVQKEGLSVAFFGFSDENSEGNWEWATGEEVTYTNWAAGQPNNGANDPQKRAQNYAQFSKQTADGQWDDGRIAVDSWHFICEWDQIIEMEP